MANRIDEINEAFDAAAMDSQATPAPAPPHEAAKRSGKGGGGGARKEKEVDWNAFGAIMRRYALIRGTLNVFCRETKTIMPLQAAVALGSRAEWNLWRDMPETEKSVVEPSNVVFDPTMAADDDPAKCNLFTPMDAAPAIADAPEPWLRLLDWLISVATDTPEEEAALRHWLLCWWAYPLQNPGAKMRTALVFHGDEGAGKNLLNDVIIAIYGRYAAIVGQDELEDKFNDWRSQKLYVVGDEVVSAQELGHTKNRLKNLITSPDVQINPKGLARRKEANQMNIVFLSNEVRPLKLDNTDRRYCVIWTPPQREAAFYNEVATWFEAGGAQALHRFLLDYDTSDFNAHAKPPMTRAKVKLIDLSRSSSETFLLDWAEGDTPYPFVSGSKQQVYDGYKKWSLRTGQRFTQDINVFSRQIERLAESNSMPVRAWRGDVGTGAATKTMRCWQVGTRPERFANDREWMAWCVDDWTTALRQSGSNIGGSDDAPM